MCHDVIRYRVPIHRHCVCCLVRSQAGGDNVIPALWPFMPWGPAIDGDKAGLLDVPLNLLTAGSFNKVPTIFGTNKNEGSIFVPAILLMVPNTSLPISDDDITKGASPLCLAVR